MLDGKSITFLNDKGFLVRCVKVGGVGVSGLGMSGLRVSGCQC